MERSSQIAPKCRILIVSASDTRFFGFLQDMLGSIEPWLAADNVHLACFDIGLAHSDRDWLQRKDAMVVAPHAHFGLNSGDYPPALLSFLARPFLPEYFPGYDVYLWIDSDVWLQDLAVLTQYAEGALDCGIAIAHEREKGYRFQPWLLGWTTKHFILGYGPFNAAYLLTRRHLNAGFFAIRNDAPHWAAWAARYEAAIRRTKALVPHDQFALNHALHSRPAGAARRLPARFLDPRCNWICDRGIPMWNDASQAFCKPYAPFEPIGALHLAGPAKRSLYTIRRTGGGAFSTYLLRGAAPSAPALQPPSPLPAPT
ncbi:hypothetical protein [Roseomonas sp. BN140053]|uniref:hypothetical protein n=1 Tax=Roseomonas sp. BN140053 TaxID=3391898 RepID=UPI0039E94E5A